ncbi:uncharacterized protein FTOL_13966 [Fusarium torulosum]|uniref:Uncharacterized protein n=1 Tax=Fusarium torulosum TaxID=33205 RepID=A0AAE8SQQ6_9HYPO|nr:uncharacterized protein FTOL_13966 [Fusarium torulosum]
MTGYTYITIIIGY